MQILVIFPPSHSSASPPFIFSSEHFSSLWLFAPLISLSHILSSFPLPLHIPLPSFHVFLYLSFSPFLLLPASIFLPLPIIPLSTPPLYPHLLLFSSFNHFIPNHPQPSLSFLFIALLSLRSSTPLHPLSSSSPLPPPPSFPSHNTPCYRTNCLPPPSPTPHPISPLRR